MMSNTLTGRPTWPAPKPAARSTDLLLKYFITLVLITGLVLIGRFFQEGIIKHAYYIALAEQQQSTSLEIQVERGTIYATDAEQDLDVILATSIECFAVSATPRYVKHPDQVIPILVDELKVDQDKLESQLTYNGTSDWPDGKGNYMPPIAHGLTKDQVEALAAKLDPSTTVKFDEAQGDILYFTNGLYFIREYQRVYPEDTLAAQVLGYVNFEGKGQYGFEEYNSHDLQGSAGNIAVERDSQGRLLDQIGSVKSKDGYSYILTIDRNVQYTVEQTLADGVKKYQADNGSAVVLQAKTGAVLALANWPTYDPNKFFDVPQDQNSVFKDNAISSRYEFGSVYKPLTVASALDAGVANTTERATYQGTIHVGGQTISNVGNKTYNNITFTEALEYSVNTAMVELSNRMGSDKFRSYLDRLGFGKETGIELSGETSGYLIPLDKMKEINRNTIAFGQGIDTTTLQIADAYTALANDGVLLQPHLIDTVIDPDGTKHKVEPKEVGQVFSAQTATTVRDMMVSVVVYGQSKLANVRGYKIAGKTGTAQIPNPKGGYYDDRTRHSFIAIFPSDKPEFILFLTLENPKTAPYAESTAAPMSGELAKYLLNYYQIPPTNR